MQDTLEQKPCIIRSESRNVEVEWNDVKECVLEKMISKMDERTKWKNVNTKECRKNYRK
jgi:hypothetical protein